MVKVGMIIGDRYEILEKIGTGGMSDVYKAKCHKLNRFVAIKILKQEFSENTSFLTRFRTEAQSAAGLMHPNIVNVYDVGEENGIYYIVMELVEGITLKKYIEKKIKLSVKEAVSIAIQVSMGIESAHNNKIIHRDIKPQNIMISKDGKVKVTDFGIAKATTSDTITSHVMGSVHYTSPEQARGGYSDARSDIYSLGITLYEMLTGRLPFTGDTTVSIAIKHIQDEIVSPREYVPEMPLSVEMIVLKSTQKSPDRRYQSISELVDDLKKSLISPYEDFVRLDDTVETDKTRAASKEEIRQIRHTTGRSAGRGLNEEDEFKEDVYERSERKKSSNTSSQKNPPSRRQGSKAVNNRNTSSKRSKSRSDEDYDPSMDRLITILTAVAAIIVAGIVLFVTAKAVGLFGSAPPKGQVESQIEMPNVVNETLENAKKILNQYRIMFEVKYDESGTVEKNHIISTDIKAGTSVPTGKTVVLTVSSGIGGTGVPNVVGKTEAEATSRLETEGFVVIKERESSNSVSKGLVISQSPEPAISAQRGTNVTIIISQGKAEDEIIMPSLLGMTEQAAKSQLEMLGLVCNSVSEEYSAEYGAGQVCYQSYSSGKHLKEGTGVDIRISLGAPDTYYSYSENLPSPDGYQGGSASVELKSATGEILYSTNTSSFPVPINIKNIKGAERGTITINYTINTNIETIDANGNVVTQPMQEPRTYTKEVVFKQQ